MTVPHGSSADDHRPKSIHVAPSLHWTEAAGWSSVLETVVAESPLAIEIAYERSGCEVAQVLAVTMRTPGHDDELSLGFLLSEGLISNTADVQALVPANKNARGEAIATQRVRLARAPREDLQRISRGLVTSSACGLCGRVSLEGLPLEPVAPTATEPRMPANLINRLTDRLREQQAIFAETGGSHGAALANALGHTLLVREDVGRHNAVDKLFGAALLRGITATGGILVLSSRASFELVQKAAAAHIAMIIAVGAPSSFAVSLAHAAGITLVGFSRPGRFNVYTHADRLDLGAASAESDADAPDLADSSAPDQRGADMLPRPLP